MKFSIVIPTYERSKLLANTLKFINKQKTHLDQLEVIIVDDGSKDNTREIVEVIQKESLFNIEYIYLPRTEKSCRSRTRNVGIKKACGEILILLDDDILIKPDFLEEQARYHEKADNLLVTGCRRLLNRDLTDLISEDIDLFNTYLPKIELSMDSVEIRDFIFNSFSYNMSRVPDPWRFVFSCNLSVKRKTIIETNTYFDEDIIKWGSGDVDFSYVLYSRGCKIVINNNLQVYHQFHEKAAIDSLLTIYKENEEHFYKKHGIPLGNSGEVIMKRLREEKPVPGGMKVVFLKNKKHTDSIKKEILENHFIQYMIFDKTSSDLDIELQLLDSQEGLQPLYYPENNTWVGNFFAPLYKYERINRTIL